MKNIIKYIAVFAIVFAFTSCEENNNFKESEIALTPVYLITDINGSRAPNKINIYKLKNIITEYATLDKLSSFTSSGFTDTSSDTNYEVTVNKLNGDTTMSYVLSADKFTGAGTLTIDNITIYDVKVSEGEVYN